MSLLLSTQRINDYLTTKNRMVMSPMCQYMGEKGEASHYHLVHYGTRAVGGAGIIIQEATAVLPEGRITQQELGIWSDKQLPKFKEITQFIQQYGAIPGIQLAHAGRKGSTKRPWDGGEQMAPSEKLGWQTVSSTNQPFSATDAAPKALTIPEIKNIVLAFKKAARRSIEAGYQIIEIHAAHGYLIHQFLSPLINDRTDEYGGSFDNRVRFLLEIVAAIQSELKQESLWVRISASDWAEGGWDIKDSIQLAKILEEKGIDLLDISSGGAVESQKIKVEKGYQVPFARAIKAEVTTMLIGVVGLIVDAKQAEAILEQGDADLILLGRELLYNPYFPLHAQQELDQTVDFIDPYQRARALFRYK